MQKDAREVFLILNNKDNLPIVLTVAQVKEILGVSRVTAYQLVHSDGFPRIFVGRRIVIPRDSFFQWVKNNEGKKVM